MIVIGDTNADLMIHWQPTFKCNYRCEYCLQTDKTLHDNRYLETAELLIPLIYQFKIKRLEITGGEVSILDDKLIEIINKLDANTHVLWVTNGSNLDWFKKTKNKNHSVRISLHESQKSLDDIKKDIEKYMDEITGIHLDMVLTEYNSEKVEYAKKIMPLPITIRKEENTPYEKVKSSLINVNILENNCSNIKLGEKAFCKKQCKCNPNLFKIDPNGKIYHCFHENNELFNDHILNHSLQETIFKMYDKINNPIELCKESCYQQIPNIVQYFEE